jgi:hypothetical protein
MVANHEASFRLLFRGCLASFTKEQNSALDRQPERYDLVSIYHSHGLGSSAPYNLKEKNDNSIKETRLIMIVRMDTVEQINISTKIGLYFVKNKIEYSITIMEING